MIEKLGEIYNFDIDTPYYKYSNKIKNIILYGTDDEVVVEQENGLSSVSGKFKFAGVHLADSSGKEMRALLSCSLKPEYQQYRNP